MQFNNSTHPTNSEYRSICSNFEDVLSENNLLLFWWIVVPSFSLSLYLCLYFIHAFDLQLYMYTQYTLLLRLFAAYLSLFIFIFCLYGTISFYIVDNVLMFRVFAYMSIRYVCYFYECYEARNWTVRKLFWELKHEFDFHGDYQRFLWFSGW